MLGARYHPHIHDLPANDQFLVSLIATEMFISIEYTNAVWHLAGKHEVMQNHEDGRRYVAVRVQHGRSQERCSGEPASVRNGSDVER